VKELTETTGWKRFAIFSDSLSSKQSFETGRSQSRPNLFTEIIDRLYDMVSEIVLIWVPSHIGIQGNEKADALAGSATAKPTVDMEIKWELSDAYAHVARYITAKWQEQWNNGTTGRHRHAVGPVITRDCRIVYRSRSLEVMAHRLRLGKCGLNAYLHAMDRHDTGLCEKCQVPETIGHYLLECESEVTKEIRRKCEELNVERTLPAILNCTAVLEIIHRTNKRRL
jgi:hypothetical protein